MAERYYHGVGINDVDYKVTVHEELPAIGGKRQQRMVWKCPVYTKWVDVLKRVYSPKFHSKYPTYKCCTLQESWHKLSAFKVWFDKKEVVGKGLHLDKDFLFEGNKHYSENTCILIPSIVNNFIGTGAHSRKIDVNLPIGVSPTQQEGVYRARCSDPFKRYPAEIGRFSCVEDAHLAWKQKKHQYACELANSEYVIDERLKEALISRFK